MNTQPKTIITPVVLLADWHVRAVSYWQKSNVDLKHFSEACYHVENKIALAADCVCDVRTIQLYAAAWSLYQELLYEYGETVSLLWESGEISLWRKAPQLRNTLKLSLGKTYAYLKTAIKSKMNRDSFAAHVDEKENDTPKWKRRLLSAMRLLKPSKNDYKSEMPPKAQARYEQWISYSARELEEIAEMDE